MTEQKLTKTRDLRDSRPLWIDSPRITVRSKSSIGMDHYDIVIVGAGISGALVAQALVKPGTSVLIIDKRSPVHGSSIASTAMIQHEIDVPLHKLQTMIGEEQANRAWLRSAKAVLKLEDIVRSLEISCSMQRKQALYVAGDEMGARVLKNEMEARVKAGIGAKFIDKAGMKKLYEIESSGAILSDISASANPGQLTAGLLRHAAKLGAEIVSGVEITDIKSFKENVVLGTAAGKLVTAEHVVFCTGYEFLKSLDNKKHEIISTWAIASRAGIALPNWLNNHILWEASDPYLYLRTDNKGRLIVGGEDENSPSAYHSQAKLHTKEKTIQQKVSKLLGVDIGPVEYRWAAAFGSTSTGLPLIGPVPDMQNVYCVMGFGGNGITFSQIAAEMVSSAINGARDPDAELFALK
ncbi:NAD(P)/FAD-dependent oxidoreductase [Pseudochrobactrum kiredjianiae]|uniref:NAD(P)/FAD-dependent oxidoreductase n=1 Tax=Pseudochrobactrum kiredjianiae TaxID=386305 RepID=A0ABW3UZY4_9HYPH|nr:FAD-dependent oxidoreductase [Pseudochrobactrum kiredjianiae]MDM7852474.1 FAD-dependent oxidoreductase [Pseudochrobactrum kiredjianiae]